MSAYDWKNCPCCQNKKRKLETKLIDERKMLSDEDYKELLIELQQLKDDIEENSDSPVRHDQEVWLTDDCKLKGYISMVCQSCTANWEHKFEIEQDQGETDGTI